LAWRSYFIFFLLRIRCEREGTVVEVGIIDG
jgi:hypothetical protein